MSKYNLQKTSAHKYVAISVTDSSRFFCAPIHITPGERDKKVHPEMFRRKSKYVLFAFKINKIIRSKQKEQKKVFELLRWKDRRS